jgi:pyruvate dehydrogenase E1 component beta subunit
LDCQVELVTSEDVPMPYNHRLELAVLPSLEKIINAVRKVLYLA